MPQTPNQRRSDGMVVRQNPHTRIAQKASQTSANQNQTHSIQNQKPIQKSKSDQKKNFKEFVSLVGICMLVSLSSFFISGFYSHRALIAITPKQEIIPISIPTHFASRILNSGIHISYVSRSYSNQDLSFIQMAGYPIYLPLGNSQGANSVLLGSRSDIDRVVRNTFADAKKVGYSYNIIGYSGMTARFTGYDPGSDRMIGFLSGNITIRSNPDIDSIKEACSEKPISLARECLNSSAPLKSASIRVYPRPWKTFPKKEDIAISSAR